MGPPSPLWFSPPGRPQAVEMYAQSQGTESEGGCGRYSQLPQLWVSAAAARGEGVVLPLAPGVWPAAPGTHPRRSP